MIPRLLAWLTALMTVLLLAVSVRADEPVGNAPRDVPMAIVGLQVPPLPGEFETTTVNDWLTIAYPHGMRDRVQPLVDDADAFKEELGNRFAQPLLAHVELRLGRTPEEMAELAPKKSPPPPYAVGVAYPSLDLVLLSNIEPRTNEGTDLGEVFRHELVHIAVNDAVRGRHVPLWFNEGISIYFSGEKAMDRWKTLEGAELSGTILPLSDLDRNFPADEGVNVAYAESADFVRYLMRDEDRGRFAQLVERVRGSESFDQSMADAYGADSRRLEYRWREELSHRFSVWPAILGGSILWVGAIALLVMAYVKRRRRSKATLAKWAAEEAAEEARRAALAAVLADESQATPVVRIAEATPRIEHDGHWHTLH